MTELTHPGSASEWIARLSEDPDNATLRREHDEWLKASAQNRADWDETLRVWQMLEMTVPVHSAEWELHQQDKTPQQDRISPARQLRPADHAGAVTGDRVARISPASPERRRRSFARSRTFVGMSVAALAACLLVVLMPGWLTQFEADYATATHETGIYILPDGSRLHLGPESAVAFDFSTDRQVTLLDGEAFFEVVPMTERPFTVQAQGIRTTVLGTAFNVRSSDYGVDVAVEHGRVRVDGDALGDGAELLAGDVAHIGPAGDVTRQSLSPALVGAWRNGQLIAKDRAFAEMVETVDRYYDGWVVISDADLAQKPLTGIYDLQNPKAALQVMADAQGAEIREISPWLMVISRR